MNINLSMCLHFQSTFFQVDRDDHNIMNVIYFILKAWNTNKHYYNSWFFKLFKLTTLSTSTNEYVHFD
jgi:hypothetical protein